MSEQEDCARPRDEVGKDCARVLITWIPAQEGVTLPLLVAWCGDHIGRRSWDLHLRDGGWCLRVLRLPWSDPLGTGVGSCGFELRMRCPSSHALATLTWG